MFATRRPLLLRVAFYGTVALLFAVLHLRLRDLPANQALAEQLGSDRVAAGIAASAPIQRRFVVAWSVVSLSRALGCDRSLIEGGVRGLFLMLALLQLERLLRRLGLPGMAGVLAFAVLLPLGMTYSVSVESFPAVWVLLLGLGGVVDGRRLALVPLVGLGALVRESSILITAVYVLLTFRQRPVKDWLATAIAQVAAFIAVRLILRAAFPGPDVEVQLSYNLHYLFGARPPEALMRLAVALLPLALGALGLAVASRPVRAMAAVGLAYAGVLLVVSRVIELRAFYEVYALLTPAIVALLQSSTTDTQAPAGS